MTSRERVHRTIDRKAVDRVPYSFDLTSRIAGMLAGHYGVSPEQLPGFLGDDLLYVSGDESVVSEPGASPDVTLDHFGVLWDRSDKSHAIGDWGAILRSPLSELTLDGYAFPNGADPKLFAGLDPMTNARPETVIALTNFAINLKGERSM